MEKFGSLLSRYKGVFIILGALALVYAIKNRESLAEKLGLA
jgi:hypothetical protein